jgi:hypothetical protein
VHDKEGGFVRSFGSAGREPGQFKYLASIAAGGGGEIIVLDSHRHEIQVFGAEGELLQIIGPEGDSKVVVWDDFEYLPEFNTDAEGRLYIVDDKHSVVALS